MTSSNQTLGSIEAEVREFRGEVNQMVSRLCDVLPELDEMRGAEAKLAELDGVAARAQEIEERLVELQTLLVGELEAARAGGGD